MHNWETLDSLLVNSPYPRTPQPPQAVRMLGEAAEQREMGQERSHFPGFLGRKLLSR